MGKRFVSFDALRLALGEDAFVVLEPEDIWRKKVADGKSDQAWGFDLATGSIRRADGKYHALVVGMHPGGYPVAFIMEEPSVTEVDEEGRRIVGHVIVEINAEGKLAVREAKGLNGAIWELKPSSVSKGELDKSDEKPVGHIQSNCQRLSGWIAVYLHKAESFPEGTVLMDPGQFATVSADAGRSLGAIVKAGLLK